MRHLSARNIDLGIEDYGLLLIDHVLGDKVQLLARRHEILLETIIDELVRLGTNLGRVDRCMLGAQVLTNLPLRSQSPVRILSKVVDATLDLLGALVDLRSEALSFITLAQDLGLALQLSHLAELDGICRQAVQDVD